MSTMLLCDSDTMIAGLSCLRHPCVSEKERQAIRVWALAAALDAIEDHTSEEVIEGASAVPTGMFNSENLSAALTSLYLRLAEELGVDVPDTTSELLALVPCARCDEYGIVSELALLCSLLSHFVEDHGGLQ